MFKRGNILKLSEEGLNYIYKYNPKGRKRASKWRFKFRCISRRDIDCLSVIKVGGSSGKTYYKDFMELVK